MALQAIQEVPEVFKVKYKSEECKVMLYEERMCLLQNSEGN